jgi:hypothetical protein
LHDSPFILDGINKPTDNVELEQGR